MSKVNFLNADQSALVAELGENYGIEPEEVIFFENDPRPVLSYEANSALCNYLTNLQQINVEPVASPFADAVAVKCSLLLADGRERSAVGVANIGERIDDADLSNPQILNLASSRALRNALKAAGIDLIRLHKQAMTGEVLDFKPKSNQAALLSQAHILGKQAGLIIGDDKTSWYAILNNRYHVEKSNELTEADLADFVALLKTLIPQPVKQAA